MWRLRWGERWALVCVVLFIVLAFVGENCRDKVGTFEECEGIAKAAYEDLGSFAVALVIAGIAGAFVLNRLQVLYETRPCPRCGERVTTGEMQCPRCEFDFHSIGGDQETFR